MILVLMVCGCKGSYEDVFVKICKIGLVCLWVDGKILDIDELLDFDFKKVYMIEVVVDWIIIKEGIDCCV